MGVLVTETSKSFAFLSAGAENPAAASMSALGREPQQPPPVPDVKEPEDMDWAPPRPKKNWIRHFFANEETPPSHEEFPPSICASEPLPLLNGRLAPLQLQLSPPPQPPQPAPGLPLHHQQPSPQPAAPAPAPLPAPSPGAVYHHSAPDSPGLGQQDDDLLGHDSKRRTGSGTREVHNKLEKNRRAHLKECFELLKRQLPICQEEKKTSNLAILHSAIRHIQTLRRKEREFEHEMERLAREKISFQQRLSTLKKDLSAQWDHIDINALYPDCVDSVGEARLHSLVGMPSGAGAGAVGAPSPASTSTASAELDGGMIIDEDDDDDTMSFQSGRQRTVSDSSGARSSTGSGGGGSGAYFSPVPGSVPAGPPSLRDIHGYRGESPLPPLSPRPRTVSPVLSARSAVLSGLHPPYTSNGTHNGVGHDPREGSPQGVRQSALPPQSAATPIINGSVHHQVATNGLANGGNHLLESGAYKLAHSIDRVASAPASGYASAKLLNYSIKVATPASVPPPSTSSRSSSPTPVPSAPVGSLTSKSTSSAPASYRVPGRAPSPTRSPPVPVPTSSVQGTPLMQPLAMSIASRHIQLPVSQVVNSGGWVGVGPTILQLATSPNQRLVLESTGLTQHGPTANGTTPLISPQRLRELGGAVSSTGAGSIDASSAVSTGTAAITMPTINKMMVGTPGVAIVSDSVFHKSSTSEGVRPNSDLGLLCSTSKGLQISSENNRPLSIGSHLAQVVSTHPSLSPLVTPVSMVSQGSPVTHILAASHQLGKMTPLISPQYLGAVIKPTMVVVSSPSTLPPNSSI